jgi:LysR family transcriptional regulator, hydrogen peroxide-inducible genes activator
MGYIATHISNLIYCYYNNDRLYLLLMNLRDLQYLVAVAEHLHFGKAAKAVHVSQPTLSMQLKKLEETLGVQLFERTNKHVMLTAIGQEMVTRAQRILNESEQLLHAARAARDPEAGTLRLGIFPTLAPYLLPRLMPLLSHHFPRLRLQLVEERTPELQSRLSAGALDLAMLALPVTGAGLEAMPIFDEPFLLAVARHHPLAARTRVHARDMLGETVLLLEDGHCLREQALEVCHLAGTHESTSFRATSLETLRHMVAVSEAITLIPKLATRTDDPLMRYIPFGAPAPSRRIGLVWRAASARAPFFVAMAKAMASGLDVMLHED